MAVRLLQQMHLRLSARRGAGRCHEGFGPLAGAQGPPAEISLDSVRRDFFGTGDKHRQDRRRPHHSRFLQAHRPASHAGLAGGIGKKGRRASAVEADDGHGAIGPLQAENEAGWAPARAAIEEYVAEQEALQHQALGLDDLVAMAEKEVTRKPGQNLPDAAE